jgi:hypothetical protein
MSHISFWAFICSAFAVFICNSATGQPGDLPGVSVHSFQEVAQALSGRLGGQWMVVHVMKPDSSNGTGLGPRWPSIREITDTRGLLAGCLLFMADEETRSTQTTSRRPVIGIVRRGALLWYHDFRGSPYAVDLMGLAITCIKDLNQDGSVEILTEWTTGFQKDLWIFSWDGMAGTMITPVDTLTGSQLSVDFRGSFSVIDYQGDGIWEIVAVEPGAMSGPDSIDVPEEDNITYSVFSWTGQRYERWEYPPPNPPSSIVPQDRVLCSVVATFGGVRDERQLCVLALSSSQQSKQMVTEFALELLGNGILVGTSRQHWMGFLREGVAVWRSTDVTGHNYLRPGESDSVFWVDCTQGFAAAPLRFFVRGWNGDYSEKLPIQENSFSGLTVGPWQPANRTALFDSVDVFLVRSADLHWITDPDRFSFYRDHFALVRSHLEAGRTTPAEQLLKQLSAAAARDSGGALSAEAVILVRQNAAWLLSQLALPGEPTITTLRPAMTLVDAGSFELRVTGTGFSDGVTVLWNGEPRTTTLVADTLLAATVTASDVAAAGTAEVSVRLADNRTSSTLQFSVVTALPTPLRPVLECVVQNSPASYTAWFGYKNENLVPVYIPVGGKNKFTPVPQDRGQTTVFDPGRQVRMFSVPFDGANLLWTLNGRTSTASKNSTRCR